MKNNLGCVQWLCSVTLVIHITLSHCTAMREDGTFSLLQMRNMMVSPNTLQPAVCPVKKQQNINEVCSPQNTG